MPQRSSTSSTRLLMMSAGVGLLAGFTLLAIIALLHLGLPPSVKGYTLAILAVVTLSAGWYYHLANWENRLRRITATSLHGIGVLLILKAIAAQSVQHSPVGGELLMTLEDSSVLFVRFFVGLASTPWQWDLGILILGFGMLLSVALFAGDHGSARPARTRIPIRGARRASNDVHVNVVQTVSDLRTIGNNDEQVSAGGRKHSPSFTALETYDSDLPPLVESWVGRDSEIALFDDTSSGVVAITGIGGQGKSSLAAKVLDLRVQKQPDVFWDWRDCREQANRFRTHLVSVIEHYTKGKTTAETLVDADITWLTKYLFRLLRDQPAILVFDNIDYYVDVEQSLFVSDVSQFIAEALRIAHNTMVIFTCRPRISYPSVRFREVYLRGLSAEETLELFSLRLPGKMTDETSDLVRRFHQLTDGHPLWLNIIASQIGRKRESAQIILRSLEQGGMDERARAMLTGVWQSINDVQRNILRSLAEFPRAMTAEAIYEYLAGSVPSRVRFDRAFRGLKAISLITSKGGLDTVEPRYDLHPIVTAFIRKEYSERGERNELLDALILCCNNIVIRLRARKETLLSVTVLEQMTTKAELEVSRGSIPDAVKTVLEASDALVARGLHEELFRLSKQIFDVTTWPDCEWIEDTSFDELLRSVVKAMTEQGRTEEIRSLLDTHTAAAKSGTARYVNLCELNAYVEWFNEDYRKAISWADRGIRLKRRGDFDTSHDCEHTRALALRDLGRHDKALAVFLAGTELDSILADDHTKSKRSAAFYGNIARCLQLKKDADKALVLLAKSYDILDRHDDATSVLNRGYAALWLGETLTDLGKPDEAKNFLTLALRIWTHRAPAKADEHLGLLKDIGRGSADSTMSEEQLREWCKEWVADCLRE